MLKNYKELLRMMKLINNPNDNLMGGKKGLFIDEQVEVQLNTLERKLQSLQASLKGMTFDIGINGGALDSLKKMIDWINEAVIGIQKLGDKWGSTAVTISKGTILFVAAFQAFKKVFTLAETYKAMEAVMAKEGVRVNSLTAMINAYLAKKREEIALKATENTSEALNSAAIAENTNVRNANNGILQGQILKIRSETAALEQNTAAVFDNAAAKKINNWSGAGFYGGGVPFGKQPKPPVPTGAIGAAAGAAGAGAAAMSGLGRTAALAAAGLEAMGGPIGILITGLTVLVPLVLMYAQSLGEEETATKKVTDALSEKINESEIEISKIQQQEHAATTLATAYNNLQKKIESGTMSETEAIKAKEEAAEIEKTLSDVIGTRGQITVENGRIQIDSIKNVFKVEKEAVLAKLEQDKQSIISERNKTQEQVDGAKKRIEALKQEIEAQKAKAKAEQKQDSLYQVYYRKRAEYTKWQADKRLANGKISQEERDALYELAETYNETADNAPVRDLVKSLDEALSEVNRLQGSIEELDNSISDIDQRESLLKAQDVPDYNPGDVSEDIDKPKKDSSSDSNNKYHRSKEQDPVVISINNGIKGIEETLSKQLKELERIEKNQGVSKETAIAKDNAYAKAIASMAKQADKAKEHVTSVNSSMFDGEIAQFVDTSSSIESINQAVAGFLGDTLDYGTVACVEAITKIGAKMGNAFLSQELGKGTVSVPTLMQNAGDRVIPFDASKLNPGDIIVYDGDEHVVMYDGKGGYVGNSSSANNYQGGVVHGDDYREMDDMVPTSIIKTGTETVVATFNEKLADFLTTTINGEVHRTTKEEWDTAGLSGQIELVKNAMEDETNQSEERQKLLQAVNVRLLESMQTLKSAQDKLEDLKQTQAEEWFKGASNRVSQVEKKIDRENNKKLFELGNGATESDKARAEVEKAKASLAEYTDILNDTRTKEKEGTEAYRDWFDGYLKASKNSIDKQVALIEAQYNDAMKIIEHNAKMRDYGVDNTDDRWGQQRATDAYADLLTKRKALSKELKELDETDPKYIEKHNAIQEELAEVNKEIRDASTKHIRTIREGYSKLAQELALEGKDFGEMLHELWVDLGRNAWDILLTGKTDNPSFLAQLLGFGDVDKGAAEAQSNAQWAQIQQTTGGIDTKLITTNNYLAQILSVLSTGSTFGYGDYDMSKSFSENLGLTKTYDTNIPFSQALGLTKKVDTSVPFTKAIEDSTEAMFSMKKSSDLNTKQMLDNTNTMSNNTNALSGLGGTIGSLFGSLTGDSKLGGIIGSGISFFSSLFGLANGGSIPKFADGGAPSGRIKGAGTGRSDSILAYLRNKDKFVWLSNGEYVINEKSAKALGYDTLDKLNGYASGGPLDTSITNPTPYVPTINPQVAQRSTTIYGSNKMTEYLLREQNKKMAQQNEMLKNMNFNNDSSKMIVLNTQASSADVLRALQENPRAVQTLMGKQRNMGFR